MQNPAALPAGSHPRILLVNPPSDCVEDDRVEPPLGLLYIASVLREYCFEDISFLDMTGSHSEVEICKWILDLPIADIYGVSCFSTNYPHVKSIVRRIREVNPAAFVVLGGPHPSAMPAETKTDTGADLVVSGEGEDAFAMAVINCTRGVNQGQVAYGAGRRNLDTYPFPARDLVDYSSYSRKLLGQPVISLISSRGCVHHCMHCNSVVMGGGNRHVRYRSPDGVTSEIRLLRNRFAHYRFNDDHFTGHPELEIVLEKLTGLDIQFRIFARIEDLNEHTCRLLKRAGCVHVTVGLESLDPVNLKMLGKIHQAGHEGNVRVAKDNGLTVRASFIVGLPHDTDQGVDEAFRRAACLGLDEFAVYPLIPYPGTSVWKYPGRFGYTIVNPDFTEYVQMGRDGRTCYALQHKNFTPQDVQRWMQMAAQTLMAGGARHMSESRVAQ